MIVAGFFGIVVAAICMSVVAIILRGWILSILWGWFAIPIFHLPGLSIPSAIGLAILIAMLTHQYVPAKDKDMWGPLGSMFLQPLVFLLVGWIIKTNFM